MGVYLDIVRRAEREQAEAAMKLYCNACGKRQTWLHPFTATEKSWTLNVCNSCWVKLDDQVFEERHAKRLHKEPEFRFVVQRQKQEQGDRP